MKVHGDGSVLRIRCVASRASAVDEEPTDDQQDGEKSSVGPSHVVTGPACAAVLVRGWSGVLDRDPFDDVGDVLALVDRGLEVRVDVLPLDDLDRVAAIGEQVGDRLAGELVALVLEPVDLDPVLLETLEAAQVRERLLELLALLDDDRSLLDRDGRRRLDAVQDERVRRLLDVVEDVVEGADQAVDVLAVERGDERRLEPAPDLVADLVAAVLGVANLAGALLRRVVGPEHRLEQSGRPEYVCGVLGEHVEEALFTGDEAESHRGKG